MGSLVACMFEHRPAEARRRRRCVGCGVGLASAARGVVAATAAVARGGSAVEHQCIV